MPFTKLFRRGMSCSDVLVVLQSYLDGETDPEVARQVAAHLHRCDRCEQESEVYDRIKTSLSRRRPYVDPDVMYALTQFGHRITEIDQER